jgi:hypothetical protein
MEAYRYTVPQADGCDDASARWRESRITKLPRALFVPRTKVKMKTILMGFSRLRLVAEQRPYQAAIQRRHRRFVKIEINYALLR